MLLDALLQLADGLAVTDTDAYTTYSIDLGNITPKRDIGIGEELALVFCVDTAAAGSTDTTDFKLVTATTEDLATGTIALVTRRVANALLTAGKMVVIPIPPDLNPQRYMGGKVELGSGDTITVSAFIVPMSLVSKLRVYKDAVTWEA